MSQDSSDIPPPLRNRYVRRVAITAFLVTMGLTIATAFGLATLPEGLYAFSSAIILGWMGVSKWGENVVFNKHA